MPHSAYLHTIEELTLPLLEKKLTLIIVEHTESGVLTVFKFTTVAVERVASPTLTDTDLVHIPLTLHLLHHAPVTGWRSCQYSSPP